MPQVSRRPQHGNLHEKIHPHTEKERKPRRKLINLQTTVNSRTDVFLAVGQREGGLQNGIRSRLHHVIAADGHGIVFWHVFRTVGNDVGHNAH